ncbi:MAG: 23S rRNA (pseudouridine(1915)-N(3))-methyltransferase RlmH [Gammaproteobacteria bacterium]
MKLHLLSVARRVPGWVEAAWADYSARLPAELAPHLTQIAPARAGGTLPVERRVAEEAQRIARALPREAWIVALDERGAQWSSVDLAAQIRAWQQRGRDVALVVGGADGLAPDLLERAAQRWALSRLTLPHALVRVILAEQIYRAWSINAGHPYHRD